MIIFITGAAGFIGYHTALKFLNEGNKVIGIDSLTDYYSVSLKKDRIKNLKKFENFTFYKQDISQKNKINDLSLICKDVEYVIHLAAQAGVRYSLENPFSYAQSNFVGHLCMLELARTLPNLKHFVYASSSSVYGLNKTLPFSITQRTDSPISLYAASKKSAELMSHTYSHLFDIPMTGLRFFTAYGPWGRPDMAACIFTDSILRDKEISIYNYGKMKRNFTFIDDIVEGIKLAMLNPPVRNNSTPPHRVFNLGNSSSEDLMTFVHILEDMLQKKAIIKYEPLQAGDVPETLADLTETAALLGFIPQTSVREGLKKFVDWYKSYYKF
jgi:UDP-glucuronate 4-epimerase